MRNIIIGLLLFAGFFFFFGLGGGDRDKVRFFALKTLAGDHSVVLNVGLTEGTLRLAPGMAFIDNAVPLHDDSRAGREVSDFETLVKTAAENPGKTTLDSKNNTYTNVGEVAKGVDVVKSSGDTFSGKFSVKEKSTIVCRSKDGNVTTVQNEGKIEDMDVGDDVCTVTPLTKEDENKPVDIKTGGNSSVTLKK